MLLTYKKQVVKKLGWEDSVALKARGEKRNIPLHDTYTLLTLRVQQELYSYCA